MKKTVGPFVVDVWEGGYPVWIAISDDRGNELRLSHRDLRDLEYAVQDAIRRSRRVLGERKDEV